MDQTRDPSFQKFLDDLQKQNNKQFATQLLQLKSEREIAGEDNDKREEQLDTVASELRNIKASVTGFDVKPLVDAATNQTQLLTKSLEELSLIRKVNEGSLEYDKDSAQYRNTSGREITSDVSGKTIKKGGYIDFETAANRLAGQGKRVQEANKIDLKPVSFVPGKMTANNFAGPPKEVKPEVSQSWLEEISSGIKYFLTDGLSEKQGYGLFQQPPSKEIEKREQKISSDRQKVESPINPESDNIVSATEAQSDYAKQDLELSKQLLDTTKEQLKTLQEIRDAFAPKTPAELPVQDRLKPSPASAEAAESGIGLGNLLSGAGGLAKKAGGALARGASAVGKGALSLGGTVAKFAGSGAGKLLGATAAVGLGAYTAYQGYTAAEDSKQAKLEEVQAKVDAGELNPEQAAGLRKEIGNTATIEKSGAVGEGTGMAGGAIAGGLAGAKLGATIGTFVGGPVGTAVGAGIGTLAGGAIGAFSGTKAGKVAGEYVGKGINAAGDFFGGIGDKVKGAYGYAKKQAGLDLSGGVGKEQAEMLVSSKGEVGTKETTIDGKVTTSETQTQGVTAEKSLFGSKFLGGLISKKDQETGRFLTQGSEYSEQDGKAGTSKVGNLLGKRISGGLLGKDKYSVSLEGKDGGAEYDTQVTKKEYMKLQNLAKEGKYDEAEALFKKYRDRRVEAEAAVSKPSTPEEMLTPVSAGAKGLSLVKDSAENKDLNREAGKSTAVSMPIISNNVNNTQTTKFVPMKAQPRNANNSALDNYLGRIAVY